MENIMVRLLKAGEIECRVAAASEKGVSLLLYKDARVDQKILDETFGAFHWKRSHQSIDGNLYCTVEIWDAEAKTWVSKQDVGTTGFAEKEKSQASDSFKRACFNWGIGRELYTAPFIWVPANKTTVQKRGDRFVCSDRFSVASIAYNEEREITALNIINDKGQSVYELKAKTENKAQKEPHKQPVQQASSMPQPANGAKDTRMASLQAELDRTGVTMETVQERYKIRNPEQMPEALYNRVMSALAKTKSAGAA